VERDGRTTPLGIAPGFYRHPRLSPDGSRLAVTLGGDGAKTIALSTGTIASLTGVTEPVWSNDSRMVFSSRGNRPQGGILAQLADGSREADTILALDNGDAWPTALSPDGRWLLYYGATQGMGTDGDATDPNDLFFLDRSNRESRRVRIPGAQRGARFSPDGRWVAYQSTETGVENVFVRPWPAMDARYQVSTEGGFEPIWSRDGRELFFRQRNAVMAVAITVRDSTIERGSPQQLFAGTYATDRSGDQSWDIGPDGRFLMLRPVPGPRMDLRVVLNWIAEVRARIARGQ
jgi:serine/threonine-protein kinase